MPKLWSLSFLALVLAFALAAALAVFHWRDTPPVAVALAMVALGFVLVAFYLARPALRRWLVLALAVLGAAPIAACASLTGADTAGKQILTNLQGCDRHYQGAIGAGVSGSFQIDCKAAPPPAGAVPAAGVAPAAAAAVTAAPATPPGS